jgi:hypothetical protein
VAVATTAAASGPDLGIAKAGQGDSVKPLYVEVDSRRPDAGWAALRQAVSAAEPPVPPPPPRPVPAAAVQSAAAALASATGLVLFGFDVVVDAGSGVPYVVDINYLPSLAGLAPGGVWAAVAEAVVAGTKAAGTSSEQT